MLNWSRRKVLGAFAASVASTKMLIAKQGGASKKLGICTFSCHRQWEGVRTKSDGTHFHDGMTFFEYARSIGADGVQTSVSDLDEATLATLRDRVESSGGYLEGDIRIPRELKELDRFEKDVVSAKRAGVSIARSFLSGSRRYETWKTRAEFSEFRRQGSIRLAMIEPILAKHKLKLAVENHKDLTADEMVDLMEEFHSEWLGINVDTGNNVALLEDPYEAIRQLAPFAFTVHLKDMAVQPHERGFRLSEIPCGQGFLDLPKVCSLLFDKNPDLALNLEMATRDPLIVPCREESYWATFEARDSSKLKRMLDFVDANPPKFACPSIAGLSLSEQIAAEEKNNRTSLAWMHAELS